LPAAAALLNESQTLGAVGHTAPSLANTLIAAGALNNTAGALLTNPVHEHGEGMGVGNSSGILKNVSHLAGPETLKLLQDPKIAALVGDAGAMIYAAKPSLNIISDTAGGTFNRVRDGLNGVNNGPAAGVGASVGIA
jgi:hypothetical protein